MRVLVALLLTLGVADVVSGQSGRAQWPPPRQPPSDAKFFVFTAGAPAKGLIPLDYQDRVDSTKDVAGILRRRLLRLVSTQADGEVLIEITGRTLVSAEDDIYDVRATVTVLGQRVDIVGHAEDGNWSDAAGDLVNKILKLVKVNEQRILATRK